MIESVGIEGQVFSEDFELSGWVSQGNTALQWIPNGNLDRATEFIADEEGNWRINVPVRDLGEASRFLQVYSMDFDQLSERVNFSTRVTEAALTARVEDDPDDAHGPAFTLPPGNHPRRAITSTSDPSPATGFSVAVSPATRKSWTMSCWNSSGNEQPQSRHSARRMTERSVFLHEAEEPHSEN